jgi:hypothetical protein
MPNNRATRWLIANLTDGKMDALTLDGGGDRVLPVFSFWDEAEMYVRLQLGTPGWEPRAFSADEIASMLYRSLSDVTRVALDPLPEVCDKTVLDLLCVRRDAFVRSLLAEESDFAAPEPAETTSTRTPTRRRIHRAPGDAGGRLTAR